MSEDHHVEHSQDARGPYWRRVHRDWRFWVGVILFSAAIAIYVMSVDLSMVPRGENQPNPGFVAT